MGNRGEIIAEFPGGVVRLYEDGSIERRDGNPVPSSQGAFVDGVASMDITIDDTTGVWARIFLPNCAINDDSSARLPVVLHIPGGGFCTGSPSDPEKDSLSRQRAVDTKSIWVSIAYRRAPEHRLPTGCEDCIRAIAWLNRIARREIESQWLSQHGDLERCFLAGDSAGANLTYQVALSAASSEIGQAQRPAVKIIGMILLHPGFLKEEKSKSEIENPPDLALVPADIMDQVSILALPKGSNKNYYVFNPSIPDASQVALPPTLIIIGKLDKFYDRSVEFCQAMKAAGQDLEVVEYGNMGHCFHLMPNYESCPEALDQSQKVVNFMNKRLQMLQTGL